MPSAVGNMTSIFNTVSLEIVLITSADLEGSFCPASDMSFSTVYTLGGWFLLLFGWVFLCTTSDL